jgi:hypothetical protein
MYRGARTALPWSSLPANLLFFRIFLGRIGKYPAQGYA